MQLTNRLLCFWADGGFVSYKRVSSPSFLVWSQSLIGIITSWFAIALDEIRTTRILRERVDCKQSSETWCPCKRVLVFLWWSHTKKHAIYGPGWDSFPFYMRTVQSQTGTKVTRVGSATDTKSGRFRSSLLGRSLVNSWKEMYETDTNSYRSEFVPVSINYLLILINNQDS